MTWVYFNLIYNVKADGWTIDKVPTMWRADVQKMINEAEASKTPTEEQTN